MRTRCGTRIMGYCIPTDDNSSTQKEAPETSFGFTSDKYVNTANGLTQPRRLIVANDTLPGPQIVLYEKQTITIIVHNALLNEAVAIHWHGIDQHHTPFMDVVEFLTQRQIAPGQSFNYTFSASFWRHFLVPQPCRLSTNPGTLWGTDSVKRWWGSRWWRSCLHGNRI